jgi:hypothetical protein
MGPLVRGPRRAGLGVSAVLLLFTKPKDRTNEFTKSYMDIVLAVIVVAACVCAIACQYALLPREHDTICNITGDPMPHFLAYITDVEMDTLMDPEGHNGSGDPITGWSGTQGVKCFAPTGPVRGRCPPYTSRVRYTNTAGKKRELCLKPGEATDVQYIQGEKWFKVVKHMNPGGEGGLSADEKGWEGRRLDF